MLRSLFRKGRSFVAGAPRHFESRIAQAFSRLYLHADHPSWVLAEEMRELNHIAETLGIRTKQILNPQAVHGQSIFYASQFVLERLDLIKCSNRIALAYFHGKPIPEEPGFQRCLDSLTKNHHHISRVQVSNSAFRDFVLATGIDPTKVFLIPIGINPTIFKEQTKDSKRAVRERLGIPDNAKVIGSFQKDGVGWGDGMKPKLIKGPDTFLKVIQELRKQVPELHVMLTGPARGYIKAGLEEMKVSYTHKYVENYREIGDMFQALDLYIVASREEGGPKAILESMISGVPIVSTRVGQAIDLIQHGVNGWLADVEDEQSLTRCAVQALNCLLYTSDAADE